MISSKRLLAAGSVCDRKAGVNASSACKTGSLNYTNPPLAVGWYDRSTTSNIYDGPGPSDGNSLFQHQVLPDCK